LTRDAFYLQHALAAQGASAPAYSVEGVSATSLAAPGDDRLKQAAALVLLSTRGLDRRGREQIADYVSGGGGLFVAAGPDIDPEVLGGAVAGRVHVELPPPAVRDSERTLAAADARHPVFRVFPSGAAAVGLPTFRRVASVRGEGCTVLARFTSGEPGYVECDLGTGRVMVFASDVSNAWNNFPLHTSFVPFVQETVTYLTGRRPRVDGVLVGDSPPDISRQPGFAKAPGGAELAVNVDPAEADAGRLSPDDFQAAITRFDDHGATGGPSADAQRQENAQRLWQYLLALMIGMLLVESFVGARTA
jgi:hypothetical protein